MSRWIKGKISKAGVDTLMFKTHNCRSVSSSNAGGAGISVSEILKKGG